jgi:hypothetical protein
MFDPRLLAFVTLVHWLLMASGQSWDIADGQRAIEAGCMQLKKTISKSNHTGATAKVRKKRKVITLLTPCRFRLLNAVSNVSKFGFVLFVSMMFFRSTKFLSSSK